MIEFVDTSLDYTEPITGLARPEDISPADIPAVIGKCFDLAITLEKQNAYASKSAKKAKALASVAYNKDAGIGQKKSAIEALQYSSRDIASAVIDVVEAQKTSFELHAQHGEIAKYLFAIGVGSLAHNRAVVRELEAKLSGATVVDLSDMTRAEVINVVRQLKAQEDLMNMQDNINRTLKSHDGEIKGLADSVETLTNDYEEAVRDISELANSVERHGQELKLQAETNVRIENELILRAEADAQLEGELRLRAEADARFEGEMMLQGEAINLQNHAINELLIQLEDQKQSFSTLKSKLSKAIIIACTVGGVSALAGVASLLLALIT